MAQLSVTNSDFQAGNTIISSQMDQNFADIVAWANGNVGTDNLTALSVTAAKLATDSVTTIKILDGNVTTAKLAASAVTSAKYSETVAAKSADYLATVNDGTLTVDATAGAKTVTLFAAASNSGRVLRVKKTDSSTNAVTIDGNSSETIDGALTYVLRAQYDEVTIVCDGSNWQVVAAYLKPVQVIHESNAGQSIADATISIINFEDLILDTHGVVTIGASWKITVPRAGNFRISAHAIFAANTFSTTQRSILHLYKNGAAVRELDRRYGNGGSIQLSPSGTAIINLAATDYIDIRIEQNSGGALALTNTAPAVHVHLEEIL